jgi:AcrR family transcriptional regulator
MPRPPTITDEQILRAAREVFLEKGVTATTAEVARRAGCAEGSIFKRFPTKTELFQAAMKGATELPEWIKTLCEGPGQGDLYNKLVQSGLEAIEFFRRIMPLMMMSWSHPSAACDAPVQPPAVRALKRLAAYFDAEMRLGRLRKHDPEIFARVYAGSMVHYVFMEVVLSAQEQLPLPPETFIRGLVDLIWSGARPVTPAVAPSSTKQKG